MGRALVIFDFDGTIADSFGESLLAYNRVAPHLRLRPVAGSEVPELRRMSVGQLMTALRVPMWKLPRLMIAVRADLLEHFHAVKPIRGISRALRELRAAGYRLAIVTSNSKANVRGFLARHDLDCFPTIVAGTGIFGKARRLRQLLRAAHLDGARSVFVGDMAPDIRAAREAGTLAVAVTWGFGDREPLSAEEPAAVVDHPAELAPTIARLLRGD
jgi:phosphoglycolate phosphatase